MELTKIILEKRNGIAEITSNCPEALNALGRDTYLELRGARGY